MADYTVSSALPDCIRDALVTVRPVLEKMTDKWSILILTLCSAKPTRFNELRRSLDGITHKGLADTLKKLERAGLLTRTVLPTKPVGVEYSITPLGLSLRGPFEAILLWAAASKSEIEAAAARYDNSNLPRTSDHGDDIPPPTDVVARRNKTSNKPFA